MSGPVVAEAFHRRVFGPIRDVCTGAVFAELHGAGATGAGPDGLIDWLSVRGGCGCY
jgi:hypothetical protein